MLYVMAMLTHKHKRKNPEDVEPGKRLSRYQKYADGEIKILDVITGDLPKMKKSLAVDFSNLEPQQYRYISKGTIMQIGGDIEELTKTWDIFHVKNMNVQSRAAVTALMQGIKQNPQQVRNELIVKDVGNSLQESDIAELVKNQDIQQLHQILDSLGYMYDLEMPYSINAFFSRRAKRRGYESVADMLQDETLVLSEFSFREPNFSFHKLMPRIDDTDSRVCIYAKTASILQQKVQEGDACLRLWYLYGRLKDDVEKLPEAVPNKLINTFVDIIGNKSRIGQAHPFSSLVTTVPANTLPDYKDQMYSYFEEKFEKEFQNVEMAKKQAKDAAYGAQVYLKNSLFNEIRAARNLAKHIGKHDIANCLSCLEENSSELDDDQIACIRNAFNNRISCILGEAGTGKTKIVSEIIRIAQMNNHQCLILAPSAKAALHAAAEASKHVEFDETFEYQTIHRAAKIVREDEDLGETGETVTVEDNEFYKYSMIIIDEMSMCTLPVFNKILSAIVKHPWIHLVLVGDDQQLPAIGVQFFHQICDGLLDEYIPTARLKKNYRAKSDKLIKFAQTIRQGEFKVPKGAKNIHIVQEKVEDFIEANESLINNEDTLFLVSRREDCERLNLKLRTMRLNMKTARKINVTSFYVGDPVITIQNDYVDNESASCIAIRHKDRVDDIFNGTSGTIENYDKDTDTVSVRLYAPNFPAKGKVIPYYSKELSLYYQPAYALTVHKAQGSQAKQIIYYINAKHKRGLSRNALYTAVTRAQDKLYILSDEETLEYTVKQEAHCGMSYFAFRVLNELEHLKTKK